MHIALRMYAVFHYTRIGHGGGCLRSMESLKYLKTLNQTICSLFEIIKNLSANVDDLVLCFIIGKVYHFPLPRLPKALSSPHRIQHWWVLVATLFDCVVHLYSFLLICMKRKQLVVSNMWMVTHFFEKQPQCISYTNPERSEKCHPVIIEATQRQHCCQKSLMRHSVHDLIAIPVCMHVNLAYMISFS